MTSAAGTPIVSVASAHPSIGTGLAVPVTRPQGEVLASAGLAVAAGFHLVEGGVAAAFGDQIRVGALLHDAAVPQHQQERCKRVQAPEHDADGGDSEERL